MQRTVGDHIAWIKEQIEDLTTEQSASRDPLKLHHIEMDMRSLKLALAHYELALKLEQEVADSRTKQRAKAC